MGDGAMDMVFVAGLDHGIGQIQARADRFFQEDVGFAIGRGDHHLGMLIEPAIPNGHDIGFFPGNHYAIVGIGVVAFKASGGGKASGVVFVGDRDNPGTIGEIQPDRVHPVAVVALACAADDSNFVDFSHVLCS